MDGTIKNYDVIVIGSGNGGLTAAIRVLQGNRPVSDPLFAGYRYMRSALK